jgi:hypothetical protein
MTNRQYTHLDIRKPSIKTNGVHWEKLWFKIHKTMISSMQQYKKLGTPMIIIQILT